MARHSSSMIQGVADSNAQRATSNLQRCEAILRRRIERLRAAKREVDMRIILNDLIMGHRRVEDLPPDVVADLKPLVDKSMKLVRDRLNEMEAAREPPAPVPEIVLALMQEGAPPLGAPPATKDDLSGEAAGEPRLWSGGGYF